MREVLFVCTGNYYRSRYSEIVFNYHAKIQNVSWVATSRGFRLSPKNIGPLSAWATKGLADRGVVDSSTDRLPIQVELEDFQRASTIVALKEEEHRPFVVERFSRFSPKITYWNIHDMAPTAAYDPMLEMDTAVRELIDHLVAE